MHMVSARIMVGGDPGTVVYRNREHALSWPEVAVIQELHGPESITDIQFQEEVPTPTAMQEKARLQSIYGAKDVETIYPGRAPRFEWEMPGARVPAPPALKKG